MEDTEKIEEVTTVSETKAAPTKIVRKVKTEVPPPIKLEHPQERYESKKAIFRFNQIVWYILSVIEVLLVFRIFLKALGANPISPFAVIVYTLSDPLALPFTGIFATITQDGQIFELSTFMAMLVYLVIAYGLVYLMEMFKPTTPREVEENI